MPENEADHRFLAIPGALALLAVASGLVPPRAIVRAVDWSLLLLLTALVLSVEIIRESGLLDRAVCAVLARVRTARSLTGTLVLLSGAIASVATNDVSLFVVIPLTVAASRYSDFRVRNAVILEIVAANLLGCLTPLGNPQNLYLFHVGGMSAARFVAHMAPFCALALAALSAAVAVMEPPRAIVPARLAPPPVRAGRALAGLAGIGLVSAEILRWVPAWVPAAFAAVAAAAALRARVRRANLGIVALFFFVFVVIAGLSRLDFAAVYAAIPLPAGPRLTLSGLLFSQVISNVPAAMLLAPLSGGATARLLYAVNAGGCGTLVASLANLLGWHIFRREAGSDRAFFWRLLRVNAAFLLIMGVAAFALSGRLP